MIMFDYGNFLKTLGGGGGFSNAIRIGKKKKTIGT